MKREYYTNGLEVSDMAAWLDLDMWGYDPTGRIRVSERVNNKIAFQPTHTLSHEEIKTDFEKRFVVVPVRRNGVMVRVKAKEGV